MRLAVALVLVSLLLPAAAAQAPPTGTPLTWFVHNLTSTEGGPGATLNFVPPAAEEVAIAASCLPDACPAPDWLVYRADAESALPVPLTATTTGGEAHVWVKSYQNGLAPGTTAKVTVFADATAIATGSLTQDVIAATVEYVIPLDFAASSIAAGAMIGFEVAIQDSHCECYLPSAYGKGVSTDYPWRFTLPVTAGAAATAPPTTYANLVTPTVHIEKAFTTATTANFRYNWTANATATQLDFSATATNGTVRLFIQTAANVTVIDKVISTPGNSTSMALTAPSGTWKILLQFTNFKGTATLDIDPATATPTSTATGSSASSSSTATTAKTSTTMPGTQSDGGTSSSTTKGSPAISWMPLLALLGAIAVLRRRVA